MARPTQPKGLKPRSEGEDGTPASGNKLELNGMKLIIVNTVITILICLLFVGSNYFIIKNALSQISSQSSSDESAVGDEGSESDQPEKGVILDLGEFILNLSDPNARRYLKVDVAIELSKTPQDSALESSGGGGGHGEAAPDPAKLFAEQMSQYKPAIRDAVISTLSSKTAEELSSISGKELAKEQIKESVNAVFGGERETLRVSFGSFIIQ